jgi:hypothetical protein
MSCTPLARAGDRNSDCVHRLDDMRGEISDNDPSRARVLIAFEFPVRKICCYIIRVGDNWKKTDERMKSWFIIVPGSRRNPKLDTTLRHESTAWSKSSSPLSPRSSEQPNQLVLCELIETLESPLGNWLDIPTSVHIARAWQCWDQCLDSRPESRRSANVPTPCGLSFFMEIWKEWMSSSDCVQTDATQETHTGMIISFDMSVTGEKFQITPPRVNSWAAIRISLRFCWLFSEAIRESTNSRLW